MLLWRISIKDCHKIVITDVMGDELVVFFGLMLRLSSRAGSSINISL